MLASRMTTKTRKPVAPSPVNLMDAAADASMRVVLLGVLRASSWNLTHAAKALGLSQATEVRRYIVRLGLVEEFASAKAEGLAASGNRSHKPPAE